MKYFKIKLGSISSNGGLVNQLVPPAVNPRNLTAKIDRPSDSLKSSKSSIQRSHSIDRKPSLRQRNNTEDEGKSKKVNILVLESNDVSNGNIEEPVKKGFQQQLQQQQQQQLQQRPQTPTKYTTNLKDSASVFASKPKIQRTPEQSYAIERRRSNNASVNQSGSLILPKYSVSEPRPSSANSTRSKNSSSSGHSNQNDTSIYGGVKKK